MTTPSVRNLRRTARNSSPPPLPPPPPPCAVAVATTATPTPPPRHRRRRHHHIAVAISSSQPARVAAPQAHHRCPDTAPAGAIVVLPASLPPPSLAAARRLAGGAPFKEGRVDISAPRSRGCSSRQGRRLTRAIRHAETTERARGRDRVHGRWRRNRANPSQSPTLGRSAGCTCCFEQGATLRDEDQGQWTTC